MPEKREYSPIEDRLPLELMDASERIPIGTAEHHIETLQDSTDRLREQCLMSVRFSKGTQAFSTKSPSGLLVPEQEKLFFNPKFWLTLYLRSQDEILEVFRENHPNITATLSSSPYTRGQVDGAITGATFDETLNALSDKSQSTWPLASLTSLDIIDTVVNGSDKTPQNTAQIGPTSSLLTEIKEDFDTAESFLLTIYTEQERWKQMLNEALLRRQDRFDFMLAKQKEQFADGISELQNNLRRMREQRTRQIEQWQVNIDQYWSEIDQLGKTSEKVRFWSLVSQVCQNPEQFLKSANGRYYTESMPNWHEISGCPRAVDFLDTLRHTYLQSILEPNCPKGRPSLNFDRRLNITEHSFVDRVGVMQIIDRNYDSFDFNTEQLMARTKAYNEVLAEVDYESLYSHLNTVNIEMAHVPDEDEDFDLEELARDLESALSEPLANVYPDEIYGEDTPPRLSEEEKLGYIVQFLNKDNFDIVDRMNDSVKQKLLAYFYWLDGKTLEIRISGGQSEQATPETRGRVLRSAKKTFALGKKVVGLYKKLPTVLRDHDGDEVNEAFYQMDSFVKAYDGILDILGETDDDGKKIEDKLLPPEKEVVQNIRRLESFRNDVASDITTLRKERQQYEKLIGEMPTKEYADALVSAFEGNVEAVRKTADEVGAQTSSVGSAITVLGEHEPPTKTAGEVADGSRQSADKLLPKLLAVKSFTFTVPGVGPQEYEALNDFINFLEPVLKRVPKPAKSDSKEQQFNPRAKRYFNQAVGDQTEGEFYDIVANNAQNQWEMLCLLPEGYEIKEMRWSNTSQTGNIMQFPAGLTKPTVFERLRLVESKESPDGNITLLIENDDVTMRVSRPDPAGKGANSVVFNKTKQESNTDDPDQNFRQPIDAIGKSGVMLTQLPHNLALPPKIKRER